MYNGQFGKYLFIGAVVIVCVLVGIGIALGVAFS